MKRTVALLAILLVTSTAIAAEDVETRLERLEKSQAELYHTLAGKKGAGLESQIAERITLSGLVEVEVGFEQTELSDGSSYSQSDMTLATAQLGLAAQIADGISADIILLYEEDATDLEVDEAAINLEKDQFFGRIGQQYLPFGAFHSHFISDPLTLELGETRETALLAGFGKAPFELSAFLFNGDAEKTGESEDHIRDWGLSLVVAPAEGLELGASYLSDLADTDAELLFDEIANPDNFFVDRVAGYSAYLTYEIGHFGIAGELLAAAEQFAAADLDIDADGEGDKPLAWNAEIFAALADEVELALRYEGSAELADQPESQYGACVSWGVRENVSLSLEYLHGEFDADFATESQEERELVTAQLAMEF